MQVGPLMVAKTGHFDTKKVVNSRLPLLLGCTPAGARTLDTLIKSQVLYQLSYGCIISELRVQRYGVFLKPPNILRTFFEKR